MFSVLIESLLLASAGIFSIGSTTLVILLLISADNNKGWQSGLGFALGYVIMYSLIGITIILLSFQTTQESSGESGPFKPILYIALGSLLGWIGFHNWRKPESKSEKKHPSRLSSLVNKATPTRAFFFGALISVINFKNLAIFLSAVSVVHLSTEQLYFKIVNVLLVVLIFTLSTTVPVSIYMLFPKRSKEILNRIKNFLETHSRAIGIWLPLVFSLIFLIRGIVNI